MNQIKIPNRMGVEQLMAFETAKLNSTPISNRTKINYIILGVMILASIGYGIYLASQDQTNEKN
jgi:hypothetical protein